jgi:uncharacterized protein (TIGR03435 family)
VLRAALAGAAGLSGMVRCALLGIFGLLVAAPAVIAGQTSGFHSVSITKRSPPCAPAVACRNAMPLTAPSSISVLPGGRFEARNQTIENMVRVAFGFEQIDLAVGVVAESKFSSPDAERFDVTAVADLEWPRAAAGENVPSEFRTMLRALLEDRFKLRARVELTDVDVLALQLTRADRQRGPGLRRSSNGCHHDTNVEPPAGESPPCPRRIDAHHIDAAGITMPQLAAMIHDAEGALVDRFVVDQTGLTGRYDVALSIASQDPDRRDAFRQALKMQLGLKLVKTKVPLPTLLIEHAEAPPAS